MDYKVMGILKRPEGMSFEEFKNWWLEVHAEKVKKWPGLKSYSINMAINEDEPFDGVAEIWFNSKEEAERIFNTEVGRSSRENADGVASKSAIFVAAEHIIVTRYQG